MIGFEDLDTNPNAAPVAQTSAADIRAKAHIVNGGDAQFPCPSCKGSGRFHFRNGRVGRCFKCNGNGNVSKGVVAAAKGKATREANHEQYLADNKALIEFLTDARRWSSFAASMLDLITVERRRLTDNQLEACRNLYRKEQARRAERQEQYAAERNAKSGEVDVSAIIALFDKATDNRIKRPIFRTVELTISKAAATGRNPGALYVKRTEDEAYLGKIINGQFSASRDATEGTLSELRAIAIDPLAESVKYARRTGRCGCCGHVLVNPVSILAGIGPICAEKWGLEWKRDLAETEYAAMKAEEVKE